MMTILAILGLLPVYVFMFWVIPMSDAYGEGIKTQLRLVGIVHLILVIVAWAVWSIAYLTGANKEKHNDIRIGDIGPSITTKPSQRTIRQPRTRIKAT